MRTKRRVIAVAALVAGVLTTAPIASAANFIATDGDSAVSIGTPIVRPSATTCTKVPYAYEIADDVDGATTVIVDAAGRLVARGNELMPGTGTEELNVCGTNLSGTTPPFTLRLRLTYTQESGRSPTSVGSGAFPFSPRTITCKKTRPPNRGKVRRFSTARCPTGWVLVRR